MNPFDVSGKSIIITGGRGLLGQQWAKALAEAGAYVDILDLPEFDVTKADDIDIGVTGKYPDALICAAGIDSKPGYGGSADPWRDWERIVNVNLSGVAKTVQVIGPRMNRGGSIVLVGSMYGIVSPDNRRYEEGFVKPLAYSASKSGLYGLCRYLAVLFGPRGVRVNVVTFGAMTSPQHPGDFTASMRDAIPLGRLAESDEWSGPIHFLVSDASSYMTGSNITVDGGYSCR